MAEQPADDEAAAPADLRLVPSALAAWAGAALGLLGGDRTAGLSWVAAVGLVGCGVAVLVRRADRVVGGVVAAAFLLSAWGVSTLHWRAAAQDPLTVAAAHGSYADLTMTVAGAPHQLPPAVGATPADSTAGPSPGRSAAPTSTGAAATSGAVQWLVPGVADLSTVGGRTTSSAAQVTVLGVGGRWSALVPGQVVRLGGLLAPDTYSVLPAVLLRARAGPDTAAVAPWWQRTAAAIRTDLVATASTLPGDAGGLLPGLVVGNTDGISPMLSADAKTTGLTHLLAVSGSHFALLCGLAVLLLRRAGPRIAALGGALVLLGLVVLVGPGPSVLRAAVMGSIALMAISVGRTRTALPALAAAVTALVLYDPTLALSAGFALSVQATAGLILLAPSWSRGLQRRGVPSGWADLVAVPAAAHVATMPVIAALSGAVSLTAIPANLLVAPVVGPALLIGMACALVGPTWPVAGDLLARAVAPLLDWIAGVAHRLARWQSAAVPWPASVGGVLGLTGVLAVGLLLLRSHRIRAVVLAVVVGAGAVLVPARVVDLGWPPPGWVLVACEVGQGDGMLLATGEPDTAVVVDTGPDPASMDRCLTRLHITTVPLIVLTHLHADHVDGLSGVLTGRSVGAIGVGPDRDAPQAWRTVNQLAAARGVPVVALPRGTRWASAELSFQVLGPQGPFRGTDSDENNDSVVLMAATGGIKVLMTGDIQIEAQQQLLAEGADLAADVLEQPHHGSAKILPAFVQAVHPQVSAIGVGRDNDYGQPAPTALAQLAAIGAVVLRTDLQGDAAVCVVNGRINTVTRGAVLPAGSSKGGGRSDGT